MGVPIGRLLKRVPWKRLLGKLARKAINEGVEKVSEVVRERDRTRHEPPGTPPCPARHPVYGVYCGSGLHDTDQPHWQKHPTNPESIVTWY